MAYLDSFKIRKQANISFRIKRNEPDYCNPMKNKGLKTTPVENLNQITLQPSFGKKMKQKYFGAPVEIYQLTCN